MQRQLPLLCAAVLVLAHCTPRPAGAETIVLTRHAEKDKTGEDKLTEEGWARARALGQLLRASGVTRILYKDSFVRLRETAEGIGTAFPNVKLEPLKGDDAATLVPQLTEGERRVTPADRVVVVVVQQGDLGMVVRRLMSLNRSGPPPEGPKVGEEYDNLFILARDGVDQPFTLVHLKFAVPAAQGGK